MPHKKKNTQKDKPSVIVSTEFFHDVLKYCSFNYLVVLDLDNTIAEPVNHSSLGSDQWFEALIKHGCDHGLPGTEVRHLAITLFAAVQHYTQLKPVSDKIITIITRLQEIGIPVLIATARGPEIIEATVDQLKAIGINQALQWKQWQPFTFDVAPPSRGPVVYSNGIIYCNGNNKGQCLVTFLQKTKLQVKNITMVDDKSNNLEKVEQALKNQGRLNFFGIHYTHTLKKANSFQLAQTRTDFELISALFVADHKQEALNASKALGI